MLFETYVVRYYHLAYKVITSLLSQKYKKLLARANLCAHPPQYEKKYLLVSQKSYINYDEPGIINYYTSDQSFGRLFVAFVRVRVQSQIPLQFFLSFFVVS